MSPLCSVLCSLPCFSESNIVVFYISIIPIQFWNIWYLIHWYSVFDSNLIIVIFPLTIVNDKRELLHFTTTVCYYLAGPCKWSKSQLYIPYTLQKVGCNRGMTVNALTAWRLYHCDSQSYALIQLPLECSAHQLQVLEWDNFQYTGGLTSWYLAMPRCNLWHRTV